MDGKEVHYSTNRASVLEFNWQVKGNHVIKLTCHAAPPMSAQPGFRQYDLSIDGQSFFTMPKVFQLGVKGAVSSSMPGAYRTDYPSTKSPHQNLGADAPATREQEEADLRRAIEASIDESRQHLGEASNGYSRPHAASASANNQADLLGFSAPATQSAAPPSSDSRSVASYYSAPTTYGQAAPTYAAPAPPSTASGAIVPAVAPPGYYQAPPAAATSAPAYSNPTPPAYANPPNMPAYTSPPPPQHGYASPPPVPPAPAPTPSGPGADVFGLHSAPVADPFAPKPVTQTDLNNAILASYQSPPSTPAAPQTPLANGAPPPQNGASQPASTNGGVTLSMNQLTLTSEEQKPKSEFEKALSNLVNIDHIDEPAEGEVKLTMMKKEEAKKKVTNGKSVPKPPVGNGMVGSNAPLSQIRKDFQPQQNKTSEGIMNAPPPGVFSPGAAQAGALVVHGQGPPPLQQASGFGVGAMMPNGGFQNQQNLAPGYHMQQQQRMY